MIALTLPFWTRVLASAAPPAEARRAPPRPRRSGPVFIHDAITPCRGETLLSLMLRREIEASERD